MWTVLVAVVCCSYAGEKNSIFLAMQCRSNQKFHEVGYLSPRHCCAAGSGAFFDPRARADRLSAQEVAPFLVRRRRLADGASPVTPATLPLPPNCCKLWLPELGVLLVRRGWLAAAGRGPPRPARGLLPLVGVLSLHACAR